MITVRKSEERGRANLGWLDSQHTFSFGNYHDPNHTHFRTLRVINEDRVQGGAGFDTHPHQDMEILTWVISGALQHRDNMGHTAVMRPGDIQRISAGTGVQHSEHNYSPSKPVHFLQVWITPDKSGHKPGYQEKSFGYRLVFGKLILIASRDGRDGSASINQDAFVYVAKLSTGDSVMHVLRPGRHAWIQVAEGEVTVNGQALKAGDGASVSDERSIELKNGKAVQVLLFDLN